MAASRTYIQMWLKQSEFGKLPTCPDVNNMLLGYDNFLNEHPEAVEYVVNHRMEMIKFIHQAGYTNIHRYQIVLIEANAIMDYKKYLQMTPIIMKREFCLVEGEGK